MGATYGRPRGPSSEPFSFHEHPLLDHNEPAPHCDPVKPFDLMCEDAWVRTCRKIGVMDLVALQMTHPQLRSAAKDNVAWARHISTVKPEILPPRYVAETFSMTVNALPPKQMAGVRDIFELARHPGNLTAALKVFNGAEFTWGVPDLRASLRVWRQEARAFFRQALIEAARSENEALLSKLAQHSLHNRLFEPLTIPQVEAYARSLREDLFDEARRADTPTRYKSAANRAIAFARCLGDGSIDGRIAELHEGKIHELITEADKADDDTLVSLEDFGRAIDPRACSDAQRRLESMKQERFKPYLRALSDAIGGSDWSAVVQAHKSACARGRKLYTRESPVMPLEEARAKWVAARPWQQSYQALMPTFMYTR